MPNLENVGDILQTLKDSGMMDQFEKDLKQMLFEQKPVEATEDLDEGADGTDEPPVDVYEFIKAYVSEKKIKLNEKVKLLKWQPCHFPVRVICFVYVNLPTASCPVPNINSHLCSHMLDLDKTCIE